MELKLKILSKREEVDDNGDKSICYFAEGNLEDYVKSIPEKYQNYEIQRGIVNNVYLDRLSKTILLEKIIPPIVLIAEEHNDNPETDNGLIINKYQILDGLQRTYRIKAIYEAIQLFIREHKANNNDLQNLTKFKLSKLYKSELETKSSDINIFWSVINIFYSKKLEIKFLEGLFKNSKQWFEIWSKISKQEQINKMLVLNAGHKPMDIKHQLELLFLNIIPDEKLSSFVRSKDINSSFFYDKKEIGKLHLSHFISALIAFDKKKPITIDSNFIHNLQENLDTELEQLKFYFQNDNLEKIITLMEKLDSLFDNAYKEIEVDANNNKIEKKIGLEWLGRETVIIGIFAAFGAYFNSKIKEVIDPDNKQEIFTTSLNEIYSILEQNIHSFKIQSFNKSKTDDIDITKVNIGNIFKYTTFNAVYGLLIKSEKNIDWSTLFKHGTKEYYECK
ncbi:hypothetical protein [Aliarcobacter butzleri]|uniref:hypothetical protein n=1 Tax=Aliarcobacter butzleri TaxID=28197 RepID=UPI001269D60C|nr:hypothetical protein [Aliarcobacter butzleri]